MSKFLSMSSPKKTYCLCELLSLGTGFSTFIYCFWDRDQNHIIRDLNGFLSRGKSYNDRSYFCPFYLHEFFWNAYLLQVHVPLCLVHRAQKVILLEKVHDANLEFKDYCKTLRVSFVIYADFETLNKKMDSCSPNPDPSQTIPTTEMEVCGFGSSGSRRAQIYQTNSCVPRVGCLFQT